MASRLAALNINKNYPCHTGNYAKVSGKRSIKWIVVHYTGGNGSALANVKYYHDAELPPDDKASAHYFVGHASENAQIYESIQPEDIAWHCGGSHYYSECRNSTAIGIETCCHNNTSDQTAESSGWHFDDETVDALVELVLALMEEYDVDIDHVIRHYDVTHKICPAMWVHDEAEWLAFKQRLEDDSMDGKDIYEKLTAYLNEQPVSSYAKEASAKGVISKIFSDGDNDGLVDNPRAPVTRQDLAVVLNRLELLDK